MSVKSELFELIQISRTNPIEISLPIDKFFRVKANIDTELDYAEKCHNLEEEIGCPLEVVFKLVNQNELYYQFYDELQHWTSVKVDLRKKVVWYCKQVGGHYACSQPLSNYGKTFWLKEDKSE